MKKNKPKIIIVEDEWIIANDIKANLEKFGYHVPSIISSGEEAIEKAKSDNPDMFIMDIVLQGNLDGTEAAKLISSRFDIPIVFLTAYTDNKILEKVKETAAYGYLVKPFNEKELVTTIDLALSKHIREKKERKYLEQLERVATDRSIKLKLFSDIAEKSPVGIQILDTDGHIMYSNSALELIYGYNRIELTGKNINELCTDPEFFEKVVFSSINKTGKWDGELVVRSKTGKTLPVLLAAFTVNDNKGQTAGTIGIIRDLTERKEAEEELIKYRDHLEEIVEERTADLIRTNEELQQEITERKKAETKLLDYQKQLQSLTSQISLIEENEKRRIASELHDCIGQNLALSKIKLGQLNKSAPSGELRNDIREILRIIEQTITETRTLTFELSPPILYELGLSQAIKWLVDQFKKKHGLEIYLKDDGHEKPFDNSIRLFLFQAVRELLVNIAKHAKADSAKIEMRKDNSQLYITVEDNGIGFSGPSVTYNGYGLFNIRERMNHINGHFEIKSKPGRGTRVTLIAPLKIDNKFQKKES